MDQDQQRKSSVDRANDFINNAKGVYQKGKQAKKVLQTIRVTRLAATAGQGFGISTIITIVLTALFLATLLIGLLGGGAVSGTEPPDEEPLPEDNSCSVLEIPGLVCNVEAPSHVDLEEEYKYIITGTYNQPEGGKAVEDFVLTLKVLPVDAVELSNIPGVYTVSSDKSTYTWRVSEPSNLELFTLAPPEYSFTLELSAKAKIDNTIVTAEFLVE